MNLQVYIYSKKLLKINYLTERGKIHFDKF